MTDLAFLDLHAPLIGGAVLVAIDQIESVAPMEPSSGLGELAEGSVIRTRSGGKNYVTESSETVRDLLRSALESGAGHRPITNHLHVVMGDLTREELEQETGQAVRRMYEAMGGRQRVTDETGGAGHAD